MEERRTPSRHAPKPSGARSSSPRKDGRECLREIKSDEALKVVPVVVLTTSKAEEDVLRLYELGVNSFVKKPVTFDGLLETIQVLGRYWLEIVELPAITK